MTLKEIKETLMRLDISSTEALVLLGLILHADSNGACWPTTIQLCRLTKLRRETVSRALQKLAEKGIISIAHSGICKTNRYEIYVTQNHTSCDSGSHVHVTQNHTCVTQDHTICDSESHGRVTQDHTCM